LKEELKTDKKLHSEISNKSAENENQSEDKSERKVNEEFWCNIGNYYYHYLFGFPS
jgi:hypothetical protein